MKFPPPLSISFASAVTLALTLFSTPDARAQEQSGDARQEAPKTLNGDFPFTPPATRAEWDTRAAKLRLQTKVALGLYPLPTRMPLNPVIHGRREMDGYTIEKVYFESVPGFYVTGNLYRPLGVNGPLPGVLCPYGHWDNGRFLRMSDAEVKRDLASGAEVDESTARSPLQARCVHLARMGCVVFHYDMIGCADSIQIPHSLVHLFRAQRPDMNAAEGWGFFSPQAESRLQSIMGLQTWDSIRALDFLTSLPEVDTTRIGVTGASGGGTQTFILGAVDPRPSVMFPAVMVSTAMQGGCTCENASLLRIGTGNVELAALFAPKPAGFTTADDWTREFSLKGFPQLQALYKLTGAPDDRTMLHNRPEFPHNYNLPSRLAMYRWMEKHLKTPRPAPAAESPFTLLAPEELTVWDAAHPAPKADDKDIERRVLALWDRDSAHQIQGNPSLIDDVLPVLLGRTWAEASAGKFSWKPDDDRTEKGGVLRIAGTLTHDTNQETLRCTFFYPPNWNNQVLIRLTEPGAAAESSPEVQKALAAGTAVGIPQLFQSPGLREGEIRRVPQDRDFLGYTDGYNPPPLVRRAHDILSVLAWMKQHDRKPTVIDIHADAAFVPETALALTQVPDGLVHEAWLASTGFRFASLTHVFDTRLLPGAVKYGDLPALLQRVQADKVVTDAR